MKDLFYLFILFTCQPSVAMAMFENLTNSVENMNIEKNFLTLLLQGASYSILTKFIPYLRL